MYSFLNALSDRREFLHRLRKAVAQEYRSLPDRRLEITRAAPSARYYVVEGDRKTYCGSASEDVRMAAQKTYDKNLLRAIDRELPRLEKAEKMLTKPTVEDVCNALSPERQELVSLHVATAQQLAAKLMAEEFSPKLFEDNNTTDFYTKNGERVRSKSELWISYKLDDHHIPYRYERPLELDGWSPFSGTVRLRPDFTIVNPRTGALLYWEHLGLMDNPDYAQRTAERIMLYEHNGILVGDQLILTWECSRHPLSATVIEEKIQRFCL